MPVVFYDSLGEFARALPKTSARTRREFNGYQSYAEAKSNLWRGHNDAVKASERLLDQLDSEGIELAVQHWEHDRTGFVPCVPSYLAGSPDSMRRLVDVPSDTSPLRIAASVCLSQGFTSEDLEKRGTAILALARKLSAIRPVELSIYADLHGARTDATGQCAIPVIKLDTSPLDLTTASYALANAGFLRQLCFSWGDARGFNGSWAWNGTPSSNCARVREVLRLEEQDLLINGAYMTDALMREPLQWVNEQVSRYSETLSE